MKDIKLYVSDINNQRFLIIKSLHSYKNEINSLLTVDKEARTLEFPMIL